MNFTIDVVGESCFLIQQDNISLLTDPWFGEPIYGSAWTQYPLPKISYQQICSITHIFISHVHADHCCIASIKKILSKVPDVKIILMKRLNAPCFVTKKLLVNFGSSILDNIVYLTPFESYLVDGLQLWTLPPTSDGHILNDIVDSTLLIKTSDGLIHFSNDNQPSLTHARFINELNIRQLLSLIPFSGGSGFPCSYTNLSHDQKLSIASRIRNDYEITAIKFLEATNFSYFMPVAGNHIVVSRSNEWHLTTGFLQSPYLAIDSAYKAGVDSVGIYCFPGNTICFDSCSISSSDVGSLEEDFQFNRNLFIETTSSRMIPSFRRTSLSPSDQQVTAAFESYAAEILSVLHQISSKSHLPNATVHITVGLCKLSVCSDSFSLSMFDNSESLLVFLKSLESMKNVLSLNMHPSLFLEILNKSTHINEADAAGLLEYRRTMPYYPELYATLFKVIH